VAISVNIFISHKIKDSAAALELKKMLIKLGPQDDRLKVHISEHIEGGTEWFKWIQGRLVESNMLLLLYTDSTDDWEWCMYEAGLFTDLKNGDLKRVICIYSTEEQPKPLKHLQGVRADDAEIEKLLKDLFIGKQMLQLDEPLNPWLKNNLDIISDRAKKITSLLKRRKVEERYSGRHLFIDIANTEMLTETKIPPNAVVTSDQSIVWSMFDLQSGKWEWEKIEKEARNNRDQMWLGELAAAMYRAKEGKEVNPIKSTYLSKKDMKNYRPILYRFDKHSDGSMLFKILFYEDLSWQFVNVPDHTATLVTALIMATRFRHEVLKPYIKRFNNCSTEDEIQNACIEVLQKINVIVDDSESRGLVNEEKLKNVFKEKKGKMDIEAIYAHLGEFNKKLSESIKNKKCEDILEQLENMKKPNNQFMEMGIRRLQELNIIEQSY
jgi:hypothetical protein